MKLTLFPLLLTLTTLSEAKNCKTGLNYCGYGLLKKGNYYNQISAALRVAGKPLDDAHVNKSLFHCDGGPNGEITYKEFCSKTGCRDGGSDHSDFC